MVKKWPALTDLSTCKRIFPRWLYSLIPWASWSLHFLCAGLRFCWHFSSFKQILNLITLWSLLTSSRSWGASFWAVSLRTCSIKLSYRLRNLLAQVVPAIWWSHLISGKWKSPRVIRAVNLEVSLSSSKKWFICIIILTRRAVYTPKMTSELIFCPLIFTQRLSIVPLLTMSSVHSLLWCTVPPPCLFSLPIPHEEPVTIQQGTPITSLVPSCFAYASGVKSLGLGLAHLVRSSCCLY